MLGLLPWEQQKSASPFDFSHLTGEAGISHVNQSTRLQDGGYPDGLVSVAAEGPVRGFVTRVTLPWKGQKGNPWFYLICVRSRTILVQGLSSNRYFIRQLYVIFRNF